MKKSINSTPGAQPFMEETYMSNDQTFFSNMNHSHNTTMTSNLASQTEHTKSNSHDFSLKKVLAKYKKY